MQSPLKDITNCVFGRLTAHWPSGRTRDGCVIWLCSCVCGGLTNVRSSTLRDGRSKSCGCLILDQCRNRPNRLKHGHNAVGKRSRTYSCWGDMIKRCTNPKAGNYVYYGGRGIKVCDRWRSFENFLADMGECPNGLSIDRIDNDGNYELSNCHWATALEQARNKRRKAA